MTTAPGLERDIQRAVLAYLRSRPGSFTAKLAAGPYSLPGLPDILHLEGGRAFFLEVKRPGSKPTPLQAATLERLQTAGALAAVVTSLDEAVGVVEGKNPFVNKVGGGCRNG